MSPHLHIYTHFYGVSGLMKNLRKELNNKKFIVKMVEAFKEKGGRMSECETMTVTCCVSINFLRNKIHCLAVVFIDD